MLSKPPLRKKPTEIIKSIPEFDKKESLFLKQRGGEMDSVHKERHERYTIPDVEKFLKFQREHGSMQGKVYSVHTHIDYEPIPGYGDIHGFFQTIINNNYTSMVVSQIDSRYKAEAGRCHVAITKETKQLLSGLNTQEQKNAFLNKLRTKLSEIDNNSKNDSDEMRLHFFYNYCKDTLKLRFKFKALPGYRFNKNGLYFEKI